MFLVPLPPGNATTKTHSIMVKGFVDLAKGHGNAMDQMLKQFLEMIGTQMIESGTFHLLAGLASMNPQEAGMGSALIGAGMALVGAGTGGSWT
jgi:purine nucleoside permease